MPGQRSSQIRLRALDEVLAQVAVFGFEIHDTGLEMIRISRAGRDSWLSRRRPHTLALDRRDAYLIRLASEDTSEFLAVSTYFRLGLRTDEPLPVQFRIGTYSVGYFLDEDRFDSIERRVAFTTVDELEEALPYLAPSNYVGYHAAREVLLRAYRAIEPRSWTDVGVSVADGIKFDDCSITPWQYARAREDGLRYVDEIIDAYYIPF